MSIFFRRAAPAASSAVEPTPVKGVASDSAPAALAEQKAGSLPPVAISLDAVIAMSGRSRRTWWRRIEEGRVEKLPADARGRTLMAFEGVRPLIGLPLSDDDAAAIVRADAGEAVAQAEVGALFAVAAMQGAQAQQLSSAPEPQTPTPEKKQQKEAKDSKNTKKGAYAAAAFYWLEQAAAQNQADAMQWLALLYAAGYGSTAEVNGQQNSPQNGQHLAVMWLAKAAAHGHTIALQQMQALMPFETPKA